MSARQCAEEATRLIRVAGGHVTYEEYDRIAADRIEKDPRTGEWRRVCPSFFAPLEWMVGWGNSVQHRQNIEKLAVFEAVRLGFIEAIEGGYRIPPSFRQDAAE